MPVRLGASIVAEFVGTFALCFIGIMAIQQAGAMGGAGLIAVALAHGIILAIAVTATMPTSGGHLNPAVTFGFLITGKIKPGAAVAYILSQILGGLAAGAAVWVIYGADQAAAAIVAGGTPHLSGASPMAACLAELIATFFLVFAVWGTAADPRAKQVGGFAIGLTIAADILAIGPITGAAMNPARVIGPAIIGSMAKDSAVWNGHWIYWVGTLIGAGLAAVIYHRILWPVDMAGREATAVDVPPKQRP